MYGKHAGKPKGIVVGRTWQSAIRSNGMKPTIYPHIGTSKHVSGFSSKHDCFGKWSKSHGGHSY